MSEDEDWRLRADLDVEAEPSVLERLVRGARGPDVAHDTAAAVAQDVVLTHDGKRLFAYAASEDALSGARGAIEAVLSRDEVRARITVSHWDDELDEWAQVDPPLSSAQERVADAAKHDAERVEERTMVVTVGREIRGQVEQTMRDWAARLGLRCELIEHRHLLTTQVAFTVTGPRRKVDEFAEGLRAEELATMRTEREVMLSPL